MATVDTNVAGTATAYSNQRKIDRCQNGVLWSMFWDGTSNDTDSVHFGYSADGGATWTDGGGFGFSGTGVDYTPNGSLFIDAADNAHVVYKDRSDGTLYYRHGTPNATRTQYTWTTAAQLDSSTANDYPDLIAFATPSATTTTVCIVASRTGYALFEQLVVSAAGTISSTTVAGLPALGNFGQLGSFTSGAQSVPSIDFLHNGDGKATVASTPHLYVAWSTGATGAGEGIRFRKGISFGTTADWYDEREIDSTDYYDKAKTLTCLFDGQRIIIAGKTHSNIPVIYERNAADTTTTVRYSGSSSAFNLDNSSATYDSNGNVYILGGVIQGSNWYAGYVKWTRDTATISSPVVFDSVSTRTGTPYTSAKRGYAGRRLDFLYTRNDPESYAVAYDAVSLNTPPNAPSWTTAQDKTVDAAAADEIKWTFSDPDPGDSQSEYVLDRWALDSDGARDGDATRVTVTTPVSSHTVTGGTLTAGKYEFKVATRDSLGAPASDDDLVFSESLFRTYATKPTAVTITAPANNATVNQSADLEWSTPNADAYQVRVLDSSGDVVDDGVSDGDTGEVTSTTTRSLSLTFTANNVDYTIEVRRKYNGLWSEYAEVDVSVAWTPPPDPTCTLTENADDGEVSVAWTNPTPDTGEPDVSYVDLYCRSPETGAGDPYRPYSATGVRLATPETGTTWTDCLPAGGVAYDYLVRAIAENGTTSDSGWVSLTA